MDCISIYAKCNSFSPRFYVLLFTKMGCAMKFIIERWFYRNDAIAIGKVSNLLLETRLAVDWVKP